jgi:hypothetical protein
LTTDSDSSVTFRPDSLRRLWPWFAFLTAVSSLGFILYEKRSTLIFNTFIALAGTVIGFILLYRFWSLIQDGNARTTPGKAVGYNFIPFFQFYWLYVAYVGLSKDMNLYCQQRNIPGRRTSEHLALWYFILTLINTVLAFLFIYLKPLTPFIVFSYIPSVITVVIHIILMKQFVDTACEIMEFKSENK